MELRPQKYDLNIYVSCLYDTSFSFPLDRSPLKPGSWKEDSDRVFRPEDAVLVWHQLRDLGFLPPQGQSITFISPSANIPTHEAAIFEVEKRFRNQGEDIEFITGDLAHISGELLIKHLPKPELNAIFTYQRWDAENLPLDPNSANVIWDRKGYFWHCAEWIRENKQSPERLMAILREYQSILKPGGIIVIDAVPFHSILEVLKPNNIKPFINAILKQAMSSHYRGVSPSQMLPDTHGQYEESTVQQIDKLSKRLGHNIWEDIGKYFEIVDVGAGLYKVRVLRKKVYKTN